MAYIVPQVLINQQISEVSLNTVQNQNVLVIGPNYDLFRYSDPSEKEETYIGKYNGSVVLDGAGNDVAEDSVVPYPNFPANTVIDKNYVKLYADDAVVELVKVDGATKLDDSDSGADLDGRIKFDFLLTGKSRGCDKEGTEIVDLKRDIAPGDVVRFEYKDSNDEDVVFMSTINSVFESVKGEGYDSVQLEDSIPEDAFQQPQPETYGIAKVTFPAGFSCSYSSGTYAIEFAAPVNESWTCEFKGPYNTDHGTLWIPSYKEITDFDGDLLQIHEWVLYADAGRTAPSSMMYQAGPEYGISNWESGSPALTKADNTTQSGESPSMSRVVTPAQEGAVVSFCAKFSGAEVESKSETRGVYNWTAKDDGVEIRSGATIAYSNWGDESYKKIIEAKFYLEYRALRLGTTTDIMTVDHHTKVEQLLGPVDPDNPLAFGTYMAALNSGDRLVYFCGVATDDLSGYNAVLEKASLTDEVYIIVPLTTDEEVIQSVEGHVNDMSTAVNKLWRIAFVSKEAPTEDTIYDAAANVDGKPFYVKVLADKDNKNTLIQFMSGKDSDQVSTVTKCLSEVAAGDTVLFYTGESEDDWDETPGYTKYTVAKVLSNTALRLTEEVSATTSENYKVEVVHTLTHAQQAKYIADLSSALASRRMYNVFPTYASNAGVVFGGEFLAAAAAGLASSVLPQQPITNVALNGIDDVPMVYQTFSHDELDIIAEGGTFIIMQDRPGSQVYVRHQISTAYSEGNLLKSELSITKNLDSISYYFAELFAPMIGKYNITPELLDVIRAKLVQGLRELESNTSAGLYGPQVLEEGTEILELRQDDVRTDHVKAKVHLNLPVPFNYFDLDLEI